MSCSDQVNYSLSPAGSNTARAPTTGRSMPCSSNPSAQRTLATPAGHTAIHDTIELRTQRRRDAVPDHWSYDPHPADYYRQPTVLASHT